MPDAMKSGNVASHLKNAASRLPDQAAILSSNPQGFGKRSFGELYEDVLRYSSLLRERGFKKGDKTLLLVKSGYELIVVAFSLFFIGAVPVIIDPGMGLKSVLRCIRSTRPDHMIGVALAHWLGRLCRKSFGGIRNRILIRPNQFEGLGGKRGAFPENLSPVEKSPEELAAIVFTSGSTGPPKGVRYMHKTFNGQILALKENFGMEEGEVDMATLPIFALFNPALGITTVLPDMNPSRPAEASGEKLVETLLSHDVTTAFASPVIGRKIATWCSRQGLRLPNVRRFFLAGAPSPPSLIGQLASVIENGRVIVPYGATEALPVSFCDHREVGLLKAGVERGEGSCLGHALPGISIKLFPASTAPLGSDGGLAEVESGDVGEICVAGPVVTEEYHRMPGATFDSKFRHDALLYHRMGDLGYFDKDGRLRFMGRKAECLQTKHGPLQTERCEPIANTVSGVRRSALIGIGRGQTKEPCMVVELESHARDEQSRKRVAKEILDRLADRLPEFGISAIVFEKSLPVDARHNAKIHRLALAKKWTRKLGGDK